jgi:hypothetical protein
MEETNVDEKQHAMGFYISTIVVQGIFLRGLQADFGASYGS